MRHFGAILGSKMYVFPDVFQYFLHIRVFAPKSLPKASWSPICANLGRRKWSRAPQERPRDPQEELKSAPERPKKDPRAAKSGPSVAQERPESSQERPKSGQERPKSGPKVAKSGPRATKSGPRATKSGPRGVLERSWGHLGDVSGPSWAPKLGFSLRFPLLFVNSRL